MPNPWRVVVLLCLVTCVGYLVRAELAVARLLEQEFGGFVAPAL